MPIRNPGLSPRSNCRTNLGRRAPSPRPDLVARSTARRQPALVEPMGPTERAAVRPAGPDGFQEIEVGFPEDRRPRLSISRQLIDERHPRRRHIQGADPVRDELIRRTFDAIKGVAAAPRDRASLQIELGAAEQARVSAKRQRRNQGERTDGLRAQSSSRTGSPLHPDTEIVHNIRKAPTNKH